MEILENSVTVVAVMILVESIKIFLPDEHKRYLPLVSIIIGVVSQIGYNYMSTGITPESIFQGIIIGGAAAGIYDLTNKTILKK